MDVFKLRDSIIEDYSRYISSFIEIFDSRITETVNKEMNEGLLWPYPLIQLNPPFAVSEDLNSLVDQNVLHKECRNIFRSGKDKAVRKFPEKFPEIAQKSSQKIWITTISIPTKHQGHGQ